MCADAGWNQTGTIFPVSFETKAELTTDIRDLNRILVPKGLRLLPLCYRENRTALLYLYRPSELRQDLRDPAGRGAFE